ncbi:DUF4082 domain-containing protein [Knoellia sp. CPCC 206450]|uniref:DUF4082 domain-containing protein n=1 Tax=Knoellia tibetensis TaxID=3404798 RepID=UPI003B43D594
MAADTEAVTLGVRFTPKVDGYVTGVEFRRGTASNTAREVHLWNAAGEQLATATRTTQETGLVQHRFPEPVPVTAGTEYVASYFAPDGRYSSVQRAHRKPQTSGSLTAPVNAGVFVYSPTATYPTQTWEASDYQVSPLFIGSRRMGAAQPSISPLPTRSTTPTSSPTSTPTPTRTATPTPTPSPTTYSCVRTEPQGKCFYPPVPYITGTNGDPYLNQNVWAAADDPTYKQTLYGNSPRDWYVMVNARTGFGGVQAYPNVGWNMTGTVGAMPRTVSSWSVDFPHDAKTVTWAAYDLWFNDWRDEVMIQVDIAANDYYDCTHVASATFAGKPWHLCTFGAQRVWKPGVDDDSIRNEKVGSIEVKEMLVWLEEHGHLPRNSTWTAASFGFEPCDTGGANVRMSVKDFSWVAAPK